MKLLEGGARLDSELSDEKGARRPQLGQRIRLPAGAIEGKHQELTEALTIGMMSDERLQLCQRIPVPSESQQRLDLLLEHLQMQLLEAVDLDLGDGAERKAPQRPVAPELQPLAQPGEGEIGIAGAERFLGQIRLPLERDSVELGWIDTQKIRRVSRLDSIAQHTP